MLDNLGYRLDDDPTLISNLDRRCRWSDRTRIDTKKSAELGGADVGCAPVHSEGFTQGPQGAAPLDLITPPEKHAKAQLSRAFDCLGQQTGLTDAGLALHDHIPPSSVGCIVERSPQHAQLRPSANQRNTTLGFDASHAANIVGTPTGPKQHPVALRAAVFAGNSFDLLVAWHRRPRHELDRQMGITPGNEDGPPV